MGDGSLHHLSFPKACDKIRWYTAPFYFKINCIFDIITITSISLFYMKHICLPNSLLIKFDPNWNSLVHSNPKFFSIGCWLIFWFLL